MSKLLLVLSLVSQAAFAQSNSLAFTSVPAIDDLGLAGLSVFVGIAAAIALKRRRK